MQTTSPTLKAALDGRLCSGCGLCAGISGGAVEMTLAAPGFLRPRQVSPLDTARENAIANACPAFRVAPWTDADTAEIHPAWGPLRSIATGHALDPEVRFAGSSGGVLTALNRFALAEGLVDAVVTVKAGGSDAPLSNPVHVIEAADDLVSVAGSRYGPSAPLCNIGALLDDGRRFAFVGKPCDVSALRLLGKTDPRVAAAFPIVLSFFCGGLPSLAGSEAVIRAMGLDEDKVVAFRYRGNGWPGMARAETADGRSAEMNYETSWGRHLSAHVQFRCKICPDAVGGVADIACADAWFGGESGYPQFEDREGRSLVIARTAAGERLLAAAVARGVIACEPASIRDIDLMQPSQRRRKALVGARIAAVRWTRRPTPRFGGVMIGNAARLAPLRERAKNFIGAARRILKGRH